MNAKRHMSTALLSLLLPTLIFLSGCVSGKIHIEVRPDGSCQLQVGMGMDAQLVDLAGLSGSPWFTDLVDDPNVTIERMTVEGMDWEYLIIELNSYEELEERLEATDWGEASFTREAGILFTTYEFRFRGSKSLFDQADFDAIDSDLYSGDPADYISLTWELVLPGEIQEHNGHNVDPVTNQVTWYIDVAKPIDLYARSRTLNIWTLITAGMILVGFLAMGVGYLSNQRSRRLSETLSENMVEAQIEPSVGRLRLPESSVTSSLSSAGHPAAKKGQISIGRMTQRQSIIIIALGLSVILIFCGMGAAIIWTTTQIPSPMPSYLPQPTATAASTPTQAPPPTRTPTLTVQATHTPTPDPCTFENPAVRVYLEGSLTATDAVGLALTCAMDKGTLGPGIAPCTEQLRIGRQDFSALWYPSCAQTQRRALLAFLDEAIATLEACEERNETAFYVHMARLEELGSVAASESDNLARRLEKNSDR